MWQQQKGRFEKLIRLLKRYMNLLHRRFGSLCLLSLSIREAIAALEKYWEGVQDSMSEHTLTSIVAADAPERTFRDCSLTVRRTVNL